MLWDTVLLGGLTTGEHDWRTQLETLLSGADYYNPVMADTERVYKGPKILYRLTRQGRREKQEQEGVEES